MTGGWWCCCQTMECTLADPDGSEHSDTFGGALSGYTTLGSGTWVTSSGTLRYQSSTDDPDETLLYRNSGAGAPTRIIMQITIAQLDSDTRIQGMEFGSDVGTPDIGFDGSAVFGFYAAHKELSGSPIFPQYAARAWSTTVSGLSAGAPASGDVMTMIIQKISGLHSHACFYRNTTLFTEVENFSDDLSGYASQDYSIYAGTAGAHENDVGTFDDYGVQIDT